MRCLTDDETVAWLQARGISQDPYHGDEKPPFYVQFQAPGILRVADDFMRQYYESIIPGAASLLHMTDWSLYVPTEMMAITGIRKSQGESRMLIEAPSHEIGTYEAELGISLFSLSSPFEWSAYLYSSVHRSTLYNWKGALFDFYTNSQETLELMRQIVQKFGLVITLRHAD